MTNGLIIKDLIEKLDTNVSAFEKTIKVKPTRIDKLIKRNSKIDLEIVQLVKQAYPQVNEVWLKTGEGNMFIEEPSNQISDHEAGYKVEAPKNGDIIKQNHIRLRLSLKDGKKLIPETNYRGAAGNVVVINDQPELILEWIDYPYLKDVQGTIEVYGRSMEPKYPSGTRVAVKHLEHKKTIQPGEDYFIIDLNYQGYIKRLYHVKDNPDIVELRSYNEDKVQFPDYTMSWNEILHVFKIRAGIQLA